MAVNTEGRREIIGLHIGPSEAEVFWSDFLKGPCSARSYRRETGHLRCSRPQGGAITRVMGATWQRAAGCTSCRNALSYVPRARTRRRRRDPPGLLRPIRKAQRRSGDGSPTSCAPDGPSSAPAWTGPKPTCSPTPAFPPQHRTKLHSTNPLERLNRKGQAPRDVVGCSNEDSIIPSSGLC